MKVTVNTFDGNRYKEQFYVYSLSYDVKRNEFSMEAGGYLIPPDQRYNPLRLMATGDVLHIYFQDSDEAINFSCWLTDANRRAEDSFKKMLD